ncbi:hypothetical protein ACFQRL_15320 [Microbacterium fluvii]|uniref:Uncharacterized protein n=1 Tax=Microbacterium fluvii TaxID=415215 RepID=A0ABW2HKV5_9MICO|nr:hypothetical protein [Microbacterium fluvii]MCU4673962.1 hypothetical protein [Microbacterium fluvii]
MTDTMDTMRRIVATAVAALLALTLGGCTMQTDSKLDDFRVEAERLTDDLTAQIAADAIDEIVGTESQARYGDTNSAEQKPTDPAWWQVYRTINLVSEPDASATAASAISDHLAADGWTEERVRETEEGRRIADGFRKDTDDGQWYIEVTWVTTAPEMAETIELTVVSPETVRGDAD